MRAQRDEVELQEILIFIPSHRASISGPLLNMRRRILLFALELFVHAPTQQRRQPNLGLNPRKLLHILLATVASKRSVHFLKSLASCLWNKKPVESESQHQPCREEQVSTETDTG